MKKYFLIFITSFVFSGNADHLILNRVCITPDQAEMIEIYNPLSESVDLTNYYLSDSNKYYEWINGESIGNFDFLVKLPSGSSIPPEGTYTITTQNNDDFFNHYGYQPDLSILDQNLETVEFGVNPNLSGSEEMLILFFWDGQSQIVQDVDYFLWGDFDKGVFKSTTDGYSYDDTILENQNFIRSYLSSDFYDSLYVRNDINEVEENQNEGNGISGHDETSENFNLSWSIQGIEREISFLDIINGDYDCAGNSQDGCPLGSLDCPIVNPSGMIVDYFDITQFGGPHAITIEDDDGFRIELTIWPDNWDIANDPEYSNLLEPPYNRYLVQALGNVFEYQGEKQILVCDVNDFEILQSYDMEGQFDGFDDIDDDGILTLEEPYIDSNGNGQWDEAYCDDETSQDEDSCEENQSNWNPEESYDDLNENGQWDAVYEELYNFDKASINPSPFVLVPSANEVLDFSYSFPSNSRVIIRVFDISGRFITTLVDKYYESSGTVRREQFYSAWDGTNQMGQVQNPGIYLMHIEASNFQTGKTTLDTAPVVIGINK